MEKKEFYHKFWRLVLPIAFQNLMSALVSASDAIMLGFLDQTALSAVSLATQVQFIYSLFLVAFSVGATVLVAQYWGKRDIESVERILGITLRCSVGSAVLFAGMALGIPGLLMRCFTNDPVLIQNGIPYLRTAAISYLLMGVSQIYFCIMKNCDRVLLSTMLTSISVVLNIILNAIFIFGLIGVPEMGIRGAALATDLARTFEVICVWVVWKKKLCVGIHGRYLLKPNRVLHKDFWHYTFPVLCNDLVWGMGFTMYSVIMGHLGNDATAANSIATIAKNLATCLCMGIGSGGGIMLGNELGQNHLEKARIYGARLCRLSVISGIISGGLLAALAPVILNVSSLSDTANQYLLGMLLTGGYWIVGKSLNATMISGIFSAGGDTKFGLVCDFINMWIFIVPVSFLAAFVFKLPVMAVYVILSMDEILKIPFECIHYKKHKWIKNVTREIKG